QGEVLLLAEPGAEIDEQAEQVGGQGVPGVASGLRLAGEQPQDPAQLPEYDHPGAILVEPAGPLAARLHLGLVGEAVERVDDLEELAERPSRIEVVVHGLEEPLAVLGDVLEESRAARLVVAAARRCLELIKPRAGQLLEPLERPVERLESPL